MEARVDSVTPDNAEPLKYSVQQLHVWEMSDHLLTALLVVGLSASTVVSLLLIKKGNFFPYLLPSVGTGADPGV